MKRIPPVLAVVLLVVAPVFNTSGGETDARRLEHSRARIKEQQAKRQAMKARMGEDRKVLEQKRAEYREHVTRTQAAEFEKKNSDKDLLQGRITHSTPAREGDSGYTAFILLRWGDLNNQIPDISPDYYSNWDGYVKVQGGGKASIVKEFAFDDHNRRTGGVERGDGIGRDSGRRPALMGEVGEGSGRDMIIKDTEASMVAWKSGIVGATDGLLIRLDLKKPEAKGSIVAGNFTIPYEITPQSK